MICVTCLCGLGVCVLGGLCSCLCGLGVGGDLCVFFGGGGRRDGVLLVYIYIYVYVCVCRIVYATIDRLLRPDNE
jgi:hypothetical protein